MNDRIRLAEAMGWKPLAGEWDLKSDPKAWEGPDIIGNYDDLPDPFTDANDCDALIKHLESKGIEVSVEFGIAEDYVVIRRMPADPDLIIWRGDNWKQGVCELALKVLDNG